MEDDLLLSTEGFIAWAEKKPADEHYEFNDISVCPWTQYLKSLGIPYKVGNYSGVLGPSISLEMTLASHFTFGSLVDDLKGPTP